MLAFKSTASAQSTPPTNSGTASVSSTEEYCMTLATEKFMSNKLTITIDYGQERKQFTDYRYKDLEGKVKTFDSVIDVLNYQNSQGWGFVITYLLLWSARTCTTT